MDLVRKWPFSKIFFLGSMGQENVFYDILQRKSNFPGYKNKKFKKKKLTFFQKWPFLQHQGITHGFGPKRQIFPTFFFSGNTGQENVYYDINS